MLERLKRQRHAIGPYINAQVSVGIVAARRDGSHRHVRALRQRVDGDRRTQRPEQEAPADLLDGVGGFTQP
jgi:hypothetical protein